MKKLIIMLLTTVFLTGCVGMEVKKASVCDGVENSFLCDKIKNPETADVLLQLANYEVLKQGVFAKQDVMDFFNDVELLLADTVTWADLVYFVTNRVEYLKDKIGVELFIVSQYADVLSEPVPISDFDRGLLLIHIERQRKIIQLYSD